MHTRGVVAGEAVGSVHGLLTSVLTGENGWLKMHEQIAALQRDMDHDDDEDDEKERQWRLPREPPKLLPVLGNACEPMTAKACTPREVLMGAPALSLRR